MKTAKEIAQWVIDNRYAKSDQDKTSDFIMYLTVEEAINRLLDAKPSASPLENKTADYSYIHEIEERITRRLQTMMPNSELDAISEMIENHFYNLRKHLAASTNTVEITDEEIEKEAVFRFTDGHGQDDAYSTGVFIHACKWYRSELRRKGGKGE